MNILEARRPTSAMLPKTEMPSRPSLLSKGSASPMRLHHLGSSVTSKANDKREEATRKKSRTRKKLIVIQKKRKRDGSTSITRHKMYDMTIKEAMQQLNFSDRIEKVSVVESKFNRNRSAGFSSADNSSQVNHVNITQVFSPTMYNVINGAMPQPGGDHRRNRTQSAMSTVQVPLTSQHQSDYVDHFAKMPA